MSKKAKKTLVLAFVMLAVSASAFASVTDIGIGTYVDKITSIVRGCAIAIAVLAIVILAAGMILKHSFDERAKVGFGCVIGGCILIALATTIVNTVFGDSSSMGALLPLGYIWS